jgi:hypothetical protein
LPRGDKVTRAPLTPTEAPTPDFEKLRRKGPKFELRRNEKPISDSTLENVLEDCHMLYQPLSLGEVCVLYLQPLRVFCFSFGGGPVPARNADPEVSVRSAHE